MATTLRNCPRLIKSIQIIKPNCRALSRAKNKKLRKAPPPPPKFRKVCRHIFPYPKCIDLFSLRPEPYCIELGGPCRSGSLLLLLAGLTLLGLGATLSYSLVTNMLFASFEEDDCPEYQEVEEE